MPLDARHKRRFLRHLLLAELGEHGQARLLAAHARIAAGAHPRAAEVARDYLARAGVAVGAEGALVVEAATREDVARIAGDPRLEDAAATLAGAFAAVEAIKAAAGVGSPAHLPAGVTLAGAAS